MFAKVVVLTVVLSVTQSGSSLDELMKALDANAAAVADFHSGRLKFKRDSGERGKVETNFVWSGQKSKASINYTQLQGELKKTFPDAIQEVVADKFRYVVEGLPVEFGAPADPRKQVCDPANCEIFGWIVEREAAGTFDERKIMLLLHPISAFPGSKLYTAKELLSVASRYSIRKTKDTTKPTNQDRIELELEFVPKSKLDYVNMTLRFDPFHGNHCDYRKMSRESPLRAGKVEPVAIFITEFTDLGGDRYFPKVAAFGRKEIDKEGGNLEVEIIELNKEIPEDEFACPFPENAYVRDRTNDVVLLYGKDGEPQKTFSREEFRQMSIRWEMSKAPKAPRKRR